MTVEEETQRYDLEDAKAAANFVYHCLHHVHVGRLDCEDKFILYHNRAGTKSADLALKMGADLNKMGWTRMALGNAGSQTFAWLVFNYERRKVNWHEIDALLDNIYHS
jgi:hypothetical protein